MSVLSAPTSLEEVHILSTAILVVSGLSAIGAGWIILSFTVSLALDPWELQFPNKGSYLGH